jgi:hypothetical protein
MINPETLAAKYAGKVEVEPAPPLEDLYEPGTGQKPSVQGQIPKGTPIPQGKFVSQVMGRGIAVVPPKDEQPNQPQMAVLPPQQSARTSIGTIVEPSKTNPLVPPPEVLAAPLPAGEEIEQELAAPKAPKPRLDLGKEILTHIWELGGEKSEAAQKFYERGQETLKKWAQTPALIPLGAIQKFLNRSPGIKDALIEELEVHFAANGSEITSLPNRTKLDLLICTPVMERMTVPYATMLGVLSKRYEMGFTFQADTMVNRSRNALAKRFLDSGCTWSLWIDSDIAAPIGHADWYRSIIRGTQLSNEAFNYEVISRLLSHNKPVIGAIYASRQWQGRLVIQPEIHPRSHEDKLLCNEIRRGTARGLAEVDWIGFGCALVHRQVFEEVKRRFPQLAPQSEFAPWRFFQPEGDEGEDEAFCRRLKACAIPVWLDVQLVCGHIGNMAFLPEHTQAQMAI